MDLLGYCNGTCALYKSTSLCFYSLRPFLDFFWFLPQGVNGPPGDQGPEGQTGPKVGTLILSQWLSWGARKSANCIHGCYCMTLSYMETHFHTASLLSKCVAWPEKPWELSWPCSPFLFKYRSFTFCQTLTRPLKQGRPWNQEWFRAI